MSPRIAAAPLVLLVALAVAPVVARAQGAPEKDLSKKSLPLRKALHYDPTLAAPFDRLLAIYRKAGRADDLVGLYRTHVSAYPQDANARVVLARLALATGDPGAGRLVRAAVTQFPKRAYLRYLHFKVLHETRDPEALGELGRAIELETRTARKRAWIDELLPEAISAGRRDLAAKHLRGFAKVIEHSPEGRLDVADQMIRHRFHALALEQLGAARAMNPPPETGIEIELAAARAEVGLGRKADAARRLEDLLARLTAEHWRRPEILRRRVALLEDDKQRENMLAASRKRVEENPHDEAAVMDLARLLAGFELRRDALKVLREAGGRLPGSPRIEKEILDLLDRLRDDHARSAYLAERLKAQPQRQDLLAMQVRALLRLGRRAEAIERLEALLERLGPAERFNQVLDLARRLRRASRVRDASAMFARALKMAPERLDVMRELAETYLALGQRSRVRELFQKGLPEGARIENLMDMAQFLVQQEFYVEARRALVARVAQESVHLEIRMLLLAVEGKLGDQEAGEELIDRSRALADTSARYRLWIESAVGFHESFETTGPFLDEEQAELEATLGVWEKAALERRLIFAEIAAKHDRQESAAAMIQADLDRHPPPDVRRELRRRMVTLLEQDKGHWQIVEEQLESLAADNPELRNEANARLVLLYAAVNRPDKAQPLLDRVRVRALRDPVLLDGLRGLYAKNGDGRRVLDILHRLTLLDPTNRGNWESWIGALAATGDERQLRVTLRKLLAGVDRVTLSDATRAKMRRHLVESYWRSIGATIESDEQGGPEEALVLLAAAERAAQERSQTLWMTWTRAFALNRLGRVKARDEAVGELERLLAQKDAPPSAPVKPPGSKAPAGTPPAAGIAHGAGAAQDPPANVALIKEGVAFPDGLTVSAAHARRLLTRPAPQPPAAPTPRSGPLPPLKVRWVLDLPTDVTSITPIGEGRLVVRDLDGNLECVDGVSGKRIWASLASKPKPAASSAQQAHYRFGTRLGMLRLPATYGLRGYGRVYGQRQSVFLPPRPVYDGEGRVYVPSRGLVNCLDANTGEQLWRADVRSVTAAAGAEALGTQNRGPAAQHPNAIVAARGGRAYVYEPRSGAVSCLDARTGKIVWTRDLPNHGAAAQWQGAGADLSGRRLFVYGAHTAILDADTGRPAWSFEPSRASAFPVRLEEAKSAQAVSVQVSSAWTYPHGMLMGGGLGGGWISPGPLNVNFVNHYLRQVSSWNPRPAAPMATRLRYVAPGAAWAAKGTHRLGFVDGPRLVLLDNSQVLILRTDLPLAAKTVAATGTYVGRHRGVLCLLASNQLVTVNLAKATQKSIPLDGIAGGGGAPRFQASLSGALCYVTGPAGYLGVNILTGERVFRAKWPVSLTSIDGGYGAAGFAWGTQAYNYTLHGLQRKVNGVLGPCIPVVSRVVDGVLYAAVTSRRVAALGGGAPDGR